MKFELRKLQLLVKTVRCGWKYISINYYIHSGHLCKFVFVLCKK